LPIGGSMIVFTSRIGFSMGQSRSEPEPKMVVEGALEGEMDDHLDYAKHDPADRDGGIPGMATALRPCSPRPGQWKSQCRATGNPASSRRSCQKRQRRLTGRLFQEAEHLASEIRPA